MEKMVNCKINGIAVSVPEGSTILEAARAAGVDIPTLCYLKEINEIGACRICVVEATGARGLVAACVYPVAEGMEVKTNTPKVHQSRRITLELILSTHDKDCLSCVRSQDCELQKLCRDYGIEDTDKFKGYNPQYEIDTSAPHLVRDNNTCILCRRCVAACEQQFVSVIGANDRGIDTHMHRLTSRLTMSVYFIRPVHRSVPDCRSGGKGRHRQGLGGAVRPVKARGGTDRAFNPQPTTVFRHADGTMSRKMVSALGGLGLMGV